VFGDRNNSAHESSGMNRERRFGGLARLYGVLGAQRHVSQIEKSFSSTPSSASLPMPVICLKAGLM
jgi:hypothetical protein